MAKNKDKKRDRSSSEGENASQGGYSANDRASTDAQNREYNQRAENKNRNKGMK